MNGKRIWMFGLVAAALAIAFAALLASGGEGARQEAVFSPRTETFPERPPDREPFTTGQPPAAVLVEPAPRPFSDVEFLSRPTSLPEALALGPGLRSWTASLRRQVRSPAQSWTTPRSART